MSTFKSLFLVMIMFVLLGKGRNFSGIDSKFFRPVKMQCPEVNCLKCFMSAGKCHNKSLSLPMALFEAAATIIDVFMLLFKVQSLMFNAS